VRGRARWAPFSPRAPLKSTMLLLSVTGSLSTCPLIAFGSRCVFLYGFVPLLLLGVSGFFFFWIDAFDLYALLGVTIESLGFCTVDGFRCYFCLYFLV
jgi:hypothetical protein